MENALREEKRPEHQKGVRAKKPARVGERGRLDWGKTLKCPRNKTTREAWLDEK